MKTIIITGATSGFGRLLVNRFLKAGDTVIATGRNLASRQEIFKDERSSYGRRLIEADLQLDDPSSLKKFSEFCRTFEKIDVLINNAGVGLFGALEDCTEEQIRYQFEVNVFGTVFLTRRLLPYLVAARGKIFNFSSVFGFTGFPLTSLYCASKFAVEGFSESLKYELEPHGVQVCLIEPGGYDTKFGNNIIWGENSLPSTRYPLQTSNYFKLRLSGKQDPNQVANGVFELAGRKKIPLRKIFGRDAKMALLFRRMTPGFVYDFFAQRLFNFIFLKV
jgi:short-subunit dehydrogenase